MVGKTGEHKCCYWWFTFRLMGWRRMYVVFALSWSSCFLYVETGYYLFSVPWVLFFSYVIVLFCLDFSLFLSKCCSHRTYYDFFLVWSDVRRCLLPEFRSLIMMHSWRFQTLPGIGIRPVKKEGFYVISENINFFCTPLDVSSLQIYPRLHSTYL